MAEQTPATRKVWQKLSDRLDDAIRRGCEAWLEMGRVLREVRQTFGDEAVRQLRDERKIDKSQASRAMKAAGREAIVAHVQQLPQDQLSLSELAKLDNEAIEEAVEARKIAPETSRAQVQEFVREKKGGGSQAKSGPAQTGPSAERREAEPTERASGSAVPAEEPAGDTDARGTDAPAAGAIAVEVRKDGGLELTCLGCGQVREMGFSEIDGLYSKIIRRVAQEDVELPEELDSDRFREVWAEWVRHRREIKKTLKPTQIRKQLRDLAKMGHDTAVSAVEQSVTNGWTGLFEPKSDSRKQPQSIHERFKHL